MRRFRAVLVLAGLALLAVPATPAVAHHGRHHGGDHHRGRAFDLEAHRGGRGLRPENTLASFGHALQLGVTTLELDTGITKDGVVLVTHEPKILSLQCQDTGSNQFVGQFVKDLTLAQLKTLDCGTRHPTDPNDPFVGTQESVPGTRMPTLDEVFKLAERYGARDVQFNIETKIDPENPSFTVDPETFTSKVIDVIRAHHAVRRSLLQSFDWRTLQIARRLQPDLRRVALGDATTILPGSKWTAGIPIPANAFDGPLARIVADQLHAQVISLDATVLTDRLIRKSHRRGLAVIPWTVNDPAQMGALIDRGVDGLITDYPDRLRTVMASRHLRLPQPLASPFDVEGHRGARGRRPENTLPAFQYALSLPVDTLELDTGVTKDGVLVVVHDRRVNGTHCQGPAGTSYPGTLIHDLTLAQIKTLDCGHTDPHFPDQVAQPGAQMPTLQEVFDLVKRSGNRKVRFNIETKLTPLSPGDTVDPDTFARKLVRAIETNHLEHRAMIQSFDWRTIIRAKQLDRRIETVALIWQFAGADCDNLDDECSLEAVNGDPSVKSPWTAGLDWWQFLDVGALVRAAHADVASANWQVHDPNQPVVVSDDFNIKQDPRNFHGPTVPEIQRQGVRVVPYTVDDEAIMQRVIDLGVDGIISDFPDTLILVAKRNGLR
jgi:glycerophosphoryl diester phosphodiesterase